MHRLINECSLSQQLTLIKSQFHCCIRLVFFVFLDSKGPGNTYKERRERERERPVAESSPRAPAYGRTVRVVSIDSSTVEFIYR
jgi:hypothetical protein